MVCKKNLFALTVYNDKLKNIVALTDYNDKLKNQTLQPQTASDKHEVLVLVLFNMSVCLILIAYYNYFKAQKFEPIF